MTLRLALILITILVMLWLAWVARAEQFSPHCQGFTWTPNPEADVTHYLLEARRPWLDWEVMGTAFGRTNTTMTCEQAEVTAIDQWEARVRAVDASGQQSAPSDVVAWLNYPPFHVTTDAAPDPEPPPLPGQVGVCCLTSAFPSWATPQIQAVAFDVGAVLWRDRPYAVETLPDSYVGATYLRMAQGAKTDTGFPLVTVELDREAEVCVLYDSSIPRRPTWMDGYVWDGMSVVTTNSGFGEVLRGYCQTFPKGLVSFGGNEGGGTVSMYGVLMQ